MCPQNFSVPFWQSFMAKSKHVHVIFTFILRKICFCNTHSDWLQLSLSKLKPPWDQLLHSEQTGVQFIQVKLTKTSYIGTLFQVRLKQNSGLIKVRYREVSLYYILTGLSHHQLISTFILLWQKDFRDYNQYPSLLPWFYFPDTLLIVWVISGVIWTLNETIQFPYDSTTCCI